MGQTVGVLSAVCKTSEYECDIGAINYLAGVRDCDNTFALKCDNGQYTHEFESDDYLETVRKNEEGKSVGDKCIYYVPTDSGNYCVFYTIGDDTDTVCVVNLIDTSRLVDISGAATRSLSIEQLIESADECLSNDVEDDVADNLEGDNAEDAEVVADAEGK